MQSSLMLWEGLKKHYGQFTVVAIFQLQQTMFTLKQGDESLTKFYARVKKLCNDLTSIEPFYKCVFGNKPRAMAKQNRDNLIKCLNGLNPEYSHVKDQILLMDPMPSMSKAHSNLLQIEKQNNYVVSRELVTYNVDAKNYYKKPTDKGKNVGDKRNMICEYCKRKGETKDACFKLHGVPEWSIELKNKKS